MAGLVPFTRYAGLSAGKPSGTFNPNTLVLHDYGGTPGSFNPYHALVMPDGSVRYRDPQNPYGAPAPHAYKMNPSSIGLSYGGPVGATPTPAAMDALRDERNKIAAKFPGIKTMSHGEAYQATAGGPQQASKDGRGLDEASWRTRLNWTPYDIDNDPNPPEMGGAKPQPATAVAGSVQRVQDQQPKPSGSAPMPGLSAAEQQQGFGDYLNNVLYSPLFMMGANVLGAPNVGTGMSRGLEQAGNAQISRLRGAAMQDELDQQKRMRAAWGSIFPNGQANMQHPLLQGVPSEFVPMLGMMGPKDGLEMLQKFAMTKQVSALKQTDPMYQAELAKTRGQVGMMPSEQRLNEARAKKAEAEANFKESPDASFQLRSDQAVKYGMQPGSPAYQSYVLTGKMPREDQQPLTATDKKAILEADEMVQAAQNSVIGLNKALELSKKAYSGPLAGARGSVASGVTPWATPQADATVELSQVTTQQALDSLKSTFGGAPTEGERKILLEIQGSTNQSPAVREAIYKRAIEAAQRRLKFNQERAESLRGGTYYGGHGGGGAWKQQGPVQPQQPAQPRSPQETKAINGRNYVKIDGQWYEQ